MKLNSLFHKRNLMLIYLILSILFSLTMVNVPVKAQDTVKVYVVPEFPDYIPGEPVGQDVFVDVYIESPAAWYNTNTTDGHGGITGWAMNIKVDPAVLEPETVYGATFGYWLFDFVDLEYFGSTSMLKTVNKTTGEFYELSEQILSWDLPPIWAHGAGGNGLLCRLRYKSLNETAYSLIDLGYPSEGSEFITFYYYIGDAKYEADIVVDGHYNEPSVHTLTVESTPIQGINFTIDGITNMTNWSDVLLEGSYTVNITDPWMVGMDQYNFVEWEDNSTNPVRTISLISNMTITATYKLLKEYTLTVNSSPITGVNFTIDGITNMTNWSDVLLEGSYTVTMPSTWMNGTDLYSFVEWEDNSTDPVRAISLISNMTITATYIPVHDLTVESKPIDGVVFTIDAGGYSTNVTVGLEERNYTVTMPSTWDVGLDKYYFKRWEDDSTNRVRTISLTSDMTITATYGPPEKYALTVNSSPITGVNFTVDGFTTRTTNWTGLLDEGAHSVEMPSTWNTTGGDVYTFDKWWKYDSTSPIRSISLTSDMTITAVYALVPPPQLTLHVNSDPITDINFTLDGVTYATNWSDVLTEGNYTIVMPSTWTTVEGDVYNFTQWEDASTSLSRVVSLTSNITITATYTKLVPPIASFTLSPTEPIVNETVTFDASASSDPDGTIVSYAWDFGDGASDSGAIVEHAYTAAGTYDVSLTVTDNDGLTHTITKSITVEVSPTGIPWYVYVAAGVAAAVIIAAVAFYFLKIKKPKPT